MENELLILREQTLIFLALLAIGYAFYKLRVLSDSVINAIPQLVLRLILPCMLVARLPGSGTVAELKSMGWVLLGIACMFAIHMLLAWILGKAMRLKNPSFDVHLCVCALPNSAFVGYPLLFEIFPDRTIFMAPYMLVDSVMLFVVAPILLNPDKSPKKVNWKMFLTPTNVALVVAVSMLIAGVQLPPVLRSSFMEIGSMSKGLGLFYIGAQIGKLGIPRLLRRWQLYPMALVKLVLAPMVIFLALRCIRPLQHEYMIMISIMSMLPSMLTICFQAQDYGTDPEYAYGGLLLTTIVGMLTMPVLLGFLIRMI